jgi:hypothetical protein
MPCQLSVILRTREEEKVCKSEKEPSQLGGNASEKNIPRFGGIAASIP